MKEIQANKRFFDTVLNKKIEIGDVYIVDNKRAEQLLSHSSNIVKLVREVEEVEQKDLTPPLKTEIGISKKKKQNKLEK